jgi:hypothetical protein
MPGPTPASGPGRPDGDDLTTRVFRALYQAYDLHSVAGIHVAVPAGSPCFAGPSLGAIARQISDHEHPAPPVAGPMTAPPLPHPRCPRSRSSGPALGRQAGARPAPVTGAPGPDAAARVVGVLRDHPCWSVFWDKAYRVWRVADDDPDSGLYAESSDADIVIGYIQAHG